MGKIKVGEKNWSLKVEFCSPQRIFGTSQQNSLIAISNGGRWGPVFELKKNKQRKKNIKWLHTAVKVYSKSLKVPKS